ncbi:MAG TPA: hypothetical protein V6D22_20220 [Candidatus Obscuribacterales bacterium]
MLTRSNALVLSAVLFLSAVPAVLADDAAQPAAATKTVAEKPAKTKRFHAPKLIAQKSAAEAAESTNSKDSYVPDSSESTFVIGE